MLSSLIIFWGSESRPKNLSFAKQEIEEYYEKGHFERDVKIVVDKALSYFKSRICCNAQSAVVFDIDDTILWSYYDMKDINFGFVPKLFHEWVLQAKTPLVPHVKRLYDFFVSRGCQIILLTGRRFDEREATMKNLQDLGFHKIDLLIMRDEDELETKAIDYKSEHRRLLEEKGYRIIATIGDQLSDLEGGYAHYKVKIPNYTYIIY